MQTLLDKIWNVHVVDCPSARLAQLYIDRLYCHEVTTPQAFKQLHDRGIPFFRPDRAICMADHDVPTALHPAATDEVLQRQIQLLADHAAACGLTYFPPGDPRHGIIHVVGPESGLTLPGMTVVCGDSHTSTHGAMGAIAFGIGTSEVEMVMASQCLLVNKPKQMRITVSGTLQHGVTAKDLALHIVAQISVGGAAGFFVEYAGDTIRTMGMDGRQTLCNMSIEMGARGAMVAPDEKTFDYIRSAPYAPHGAAWDEAEAYWRTLYTDRDAVFDREVAIDATAVRPMISYGTNPAMSVPVDGCIPEAPASAEAAVSYRRALAYMQFAEGEPMLGKPVDYVFMGSCTNGRFEDFMAFASVVAGRKKAPHVEAWLVPGSQAVLRRCQESGITRILSEAGFELRNPGCSACLAMNGDRVPPGKYVVSSSNRNFEGRQGPGARTMLGSPYMVAAAAVTGAVTDPRPLIPETFKLEDYV